jgi:hypothetical protein
MSETLVIALSTAVGSVFVALLAYLAKRTETHSTNEKTGVDALTQAVQEWKDIASRAEEKADRAISEATAARLSAEKAERDTISLVDYLHDMWIGVITGTVPPHLPIPKTLEHLLSDRDFPEPPSMRRQMIPPSE